LSRLVLRFVLFRAKPFEMCALRKVAAHSIGPILVVLGIAGELIFESRSFVLEDVLSDKSDKTIDALNKALTRAKSDVIAISEAARKAKEAADGSTLAAGKAADAASGAKSIASDAINSARLAQENAASVQQQIAKSSAKLTEVEAKAEKTKSDLINLAVCNAPRVISNWFIGAPNKASSKSYVDSLKPMAGQMIFIEVVPESEAKRAAINLANALTDAGWNLQKPLKLAAELRDGVSVEPSEATRQIKLNEKTEIPDTNPVWKADGVADNLVAFLHSYNWQAKRDWPLDEKGRIIRDEQILPIGAIRVQIGLYPPTVYVSPPGSKEIDDRLRQVQEDRKKMEAELRRQREERLSKQPEQFRKQIEIRDAALDERTKNEMSSGPCQTLAPNFGSFR
jgi:hypothetical protein